MHLAKLVLKLAAAATLAFVATSAQAAAKAKNHTGSICNARAQKNIWDKTVEESKPAEKPAAKGVKDEKGTK